MIGRIQQEENERKILAPFAVKSGDSRGREHVEEEDEYRMCFRRDVDRIMYSPAWRRLDGKTQVFVAGHGDHLRNRMTHSLEVARVAKSIAVPLGVNEDLCEAVALSHDLGHTPYGHAGEEALNECMQELGLNFEHNQQSYRVVTEFEHPYPGFNGLNLSREVLEGLMKHESAYDHPEDGDGIRPSIEAQIVNLADEIAYQHHDTEDGLSSGVINEIDISSTRLWQIASNEAKESYGEIADERQRVRRVISKMIGLMIEDVIVETTRRIREKNIQSVDDVYACEESLVGFSPEMEEMNKELKDFLMTNMYMHPMVVELNDKGKANIRKIFDDLKDKMEPEKLRNFIAGMTDRFATEKASGL